MIFIILKRFYAKKTLLNFKLKDNFIDKYKYINPPFNFNGLGELVYQRTYSRSLPNGNKEDWYQTVKRVIEGTFSIQKDHYNLLHKQWNEIENQKIAEEMYDLMYNMKFLPPGRGLWAMGTSIVHERELSAALNNCAFVSTENLDKNLTKPFEFLMDASMLGVGVGFDTKGKDKITILGLSKYEEVFVIPDSREGWVESVKKLLLSYFGNENKKLPKIIFDYSKIRKKGELIKTFGGIASGPEPLKDLHKSIRIMLNKRINKKLDGRSIIDIFNLIGKCVISGNVRRTAEIAFGEYDDIDFLDLKNYEKNPDRKEFGWTSNNSIFANVGMDYSEVAKRICVNGEPGLCWLDNMQKYSRMCDPIDNKDYRVRGGNPCLEQSLESFEMCCLVETFPFRHESKQDYLKTLKYAFLYGKTVTLKKTHWPETNIILSRNRRIGCSMSGIAQFISKWDINTLKEWMDDGYKEIKKWDKIYSEKFSVPCSIKVTSIKPSGTVSLLAGATPGIHYPESKYYIRRVRLSKNSPLMKAIIESGYIIEDDIYNPDSTSVISIPIKAGDNIKTLEELSMYDQLSLASIAQKYWSDNQVSCTVTFNPETEGSKLVEYLNIFQYKLKGISFLPKIRQGAYKQMPYEKITKEKYEELIKNLKPIKFFDRTKLNKDLSKIEINHQSELKDQNECGIFPSSISFCDTDHCEY